MRISHRFSYVFISYPRTASRSMRDFLHDSMDISSVNIKDLSVGNPYYHHITANEVRVIFDSKKINFCDYHKFIVCRNPFDRVVSLYHHYLEQLNKISWHKKIFLSKMSFDEYVENRILHSPGPLTMNLQHYTLSEQNEDLIDTYLCYESLLTDLEQLSTKLGIPFNEVLLKRIGHSHRKQPVASYYSNSSRQIVQNYYSHEIEKFGYQFPIF